MTESRGDLQEKALQMINTGINNVLPDILLEKSVRFLPEKKEIVINRESNAFEGRIFVIGAGKASGRMAESLERILGPGNIEAGEVNSKGGPFNTEKVQVVEAGHPIPDQNGVDGARKMLELKQEYSIGEKDLVIALISGGGSALMEFPVEGVSLEDLQELTGMLLESGADIREINALRKHLSRVKGGWLGKHFSPAKVVSIIISDVVGNDLGSIASGPCYQDSSTFGEAKGILEKYKLLDKVPGSVRKHIELGLEGKTEETPKQLDNCSNYIIGDNRIALDAMVNKARELGLNPVIAEEGQVGEPEKAAEKIASEVSQGKFDGYDVIIIGGETTPRLPKGHGLGGRCQHLASCFMVEMEGFEKEWTLACAGTDGADFLQGFAGAVVDQGSLGLARGKGLDVEDFLERYDSNSLLKKLDNSLIEMDDTGTNVGDVIVLILKNQ
jgi:glycerate-2-kinase